MILHKVVVRIGGQNVLQGVALHEHLVHPLLRRGGVVGVIDIAVKILRPGEADRLPDAVLQAPGVYLLVRFQGGHLLREQHPVAVGDRGIGRQGHPPLRMNQAGEGLEISVRQGFQHSGRPLQQAVGIGRGLSPGRADGGRRGRGHGRRSGQDRLGRRGAPGHGLGGGGYPAAEQGAQRQSAQQGDDHKQHRSLQAPSLLSHRVCVSAYLF